METVEMNKVFVPRALPLKEYFSPGHRGCQGCGPALAIRHVFKALGPNTIVANATSCSEIISSPYPQTAWKIPWIHVAFENAAAVATGIEAGYKAMMRKGRIPQEKITFVALAGDGGTGDIGLQALSGAMERGHDFIYICYDNEAYMNTGIQRSGLTPFGASTTTSPAGKVSKGQNTWKKDMPAIAAAHHIPYVATACPSYPIDLYNKVAKAAAIEGPAYIHILAPCPTGWRCPSDSTIEVGRMAVESGLFNLFEIVDGKKRLTLRVPHRRPVKDYLKAQGRFRHLTEEDIQLIQEKVDQDYQLLLKELEEV